MSLRCHLKKKTHRTHTHTHTHTHKGRTKEKQSKTKITHGKIKETEQCQTLTIKCDDYDNGSYDSCNLQCVSNQMNDRPCESVYFHGFTQRINTNMDVKCMSNVNNDNDRYICNYLYVYTYQANQVLILTDAWYGLNNARIYALNATNVTINVNGTYSD